MRRRRNRKHSQEDKLRVVRMYEEGYGCKIISRETGVSRSQVRYWLCLYRAYGLSGLEKRRGSRLSDSSKAEIVREIEERSLSLHAASVIYGISVTALWRWQKAHFSEYSAQLTTVSKSGCSNKSMGRPRKKPPQTELEKLQVENLELRAELDYLKKVRALVEERENRICGIAPKPSGN